MSTFDGTGVPLTTVTTHRAPSMNRDRRAVLALRTWLAQQHRGGASQRRDRRRPRSSGPGVT
jgi:hypothetical protein